MDYLFSATIGDFQICDPLATLQIVKRKYVFGVICLLLVPNQTTIHCFH